MIELGEHDGQYLDICRHYRAIQVTPEIDADETKRNAALQNAILYLILAPFDNHQSDLTHRILEDEALQKIPKYKYVFLFYICIYQNIIILFLDHFYNYLLLWN